jgi:hypothetical protein
MARETSGGRIGRTVYLPQHVWDRLEAMAEGQIEHPAFRRWEIRNGSVSSVIERIVCWDGPAKIRQAEARAAEAEQRLQVARQARQLAGTVARTVQDQADQIARALKALQDQL